MATNPAFIDRSNPAPTRGRPSAIGAGNAARRERISAPGRIQSDEDQEEFAAPWPKRGEGAFPWHGPTPPPARAKRERDVRTSPASERLLGSAPCERPDYCQQGLAVKQADGEAAIAAHRCKRWSCEFCNPINRRQVIQHAVAGAPRGFLTLTVSSRDYETPAEAAAALKRGLRLLRLRLRRHPRLSDFEFLAIFEAHKSGFPHLHLLIRGKFIPWSWLRQAWEEITGSFVIDIRKIKGGRDAARYVAKYLGKDLHAFEGSKRWWRSHGYDLTDRESEEYQERHRGWFNFDVRMDDASNALIIAGYAVRKAGPNGIRAGPTRDGLTPVPLLLRQLMRARIRSGSALDLGGTEG